MGNYSYYVSSVSVSWFTSSPKIKTQKIALALVTKKVISGWGDGPEFTYVIDRTGGALDLPPQPPLRLKRGLSPRGSRSKKGILTGSSKVTGGTEIRRIDFERDIPGVKKRNK